MAKQSEPDHHTTEDSYLETKVSGELNSGPYYERLDSTKVWPHPGQVR